LIVLGGSLCALPQAWANDAGRVHGEIVALLAIVEHGGCAFMRNGSWYASADARKLLEHKLKEAMRDPAGMPSTEHFIEKSASRSSMSGQPYMVRCAEAKPVESGPWLMGKLAEMRAAKATRPTQGPPR
jgi:hypothetical protein